MNYAEILSRRFEGIVWKLADVADWATLAMLEGVAPDRSEVEAHWPSVEAEIEAERQGSV